jgi:hypothetical protein
MNAKMNMPYCILSQMVTQGNNERATKSGNYSVINEHKKIQNCFLSHTCTCADFAVKVFKLDFRHI